MRTITLTILVALLAVAADAGCLKCDQWTGYWCFMSVYGTKAHCENPTGAGCFTWGSCTAGETDCVDPDACIQNPVAALRSREKLQIASVSITVPLPLRRS